MKKVQNELHKTKLDYTAKIEDHEQCMVKLKAEFHSNAIAAKKKQVEEAILRLNKRRAERTAATVFRQWGLMISRGRIQKYAKEISREQNLRDKIKSSLQSQMKQERKAALETLRGENEKHRNA